MKPSRRKTLGLKSTACRYCELADRTKLRQGRNYCKSQVKPEIVNGHCQQMRLNNSEEAMNCPKCGAEIDHW